MPDSSENDLPAPAAAVVEGVRSRTKRLEHILQALVSLPEDGGQPALRHRHRMRLLGQLCAAPGLPEERRAALETSSPTDGVLFELNVLGIDGWIRRRDGRWQPPEDPRETLPRPNIAPSDEPHAIVMDDEYLNAMIARLDPYLAECVPDLKKQLSATEPLTTSIALARAGLDLLVKARALASQERDPEQRARRHARRVELIGLEHAARALTETDLEKVRPGSPLAEVIFSEHALKTDGWTNSPERGWTPPGEASEPSPRDTG